jgi:hypothetical protein
MATRRDPKPAPPPHPPYYVADQALFIEHVRAFNAGDRVPVEHVERYGWADKVHHPDGPQQLTPEPPPEPEQKTNAGQATTKKEGDA